MPSGHGVAQPLGMLEVLLIEGDEKTRDLFTFFLRAKGHRVHEARDRHEAILIAAKRRVDTVLLSAKLSTLGDWAALRERFPSIPFVVIADYRANGYTSHGASSAAPDRGASIPDDALERPFTFNELSTVLDRIASQPRQ